MVQGNALRLEVHSDGEIKYLSGSYINDLLVS